MNRFSRYKKWTVAAMFIFFAAFGVVATMYADVLPTMELAMWAMAFVLALLVLIWALFDSQERGERLPVPIQAMIILMLVIGLPFYLFSSRGPGERLRAIALAVALSVCMLGVYVMSIPITARVMGIDLE